MARQNQLQPVDSSTNARLLPDLRELRVEARAATPGAEDGARRADELPNVNTTATGSNALRRDDGIDRVLSSSNYRSSQGRGGCLEQSPSLAGRAHFGLASVEGRRAD
jgi:hypothetical protein